VTSLADAASHTLLILVVLKDGYSFLTIV